jgi:hypothetical protein
MSSKTKQINYSEYFKNRFANHDTAIKKIIEELNKSPSRRKKRNYQEAFDQMPPYTRFSDELI